ncbi:MAG TPA: dihydrolipoamide acetyltransferase family protein [Xanthobacteraceae bacterium]|jgi:pyruvate dehydrogenase E2 component (dihydrolipoamide acetyltransferase)|nr:dihydrolipoamide acetyltransferase family protein [Xanthobacteraceae bacterium]
MDVLMPQLGETVSEGKITTWFKKTGDAVRPGENLFEIETDKVSMEVPATTAGIIAEIRVGAGSVAPVGAVVAVIADSVGAAASTAAVPANPPPSRPAPPPAPLSSSVSVAQPVRQPRLGPLDPFHAVRTPDRNFGPAKLPNGITITPLARRLAAEANIDVARVAGSGPHGRIVANDVTAAVAAKGSTGALRGPSAAEVKALYADSPFEEVPLDAMRRTIAKRLVESVQTIPHFNLTLDVELDRLLALRDDANAAAPKDADRQPRFKLSVNDFVIKALALALQQVPAANAVWAEDRILRFKHSDIGVAVALEGGLLTPVIRRAETKTLSAISIEMRDLTNRARDRRLSPGEYQGGSTAISNLGMFGIREFSAIINPPHATILAVGASARRPVERNGALAFVDQMTVTLSCDHRVIDGALGAQLLAAFKGFMEQPVTALV